MVIMTKVPYFKMYSLKLCHVELRAVLAFSLQRYYKTACSAALLGGRAGSGGTAPFQPGSAEG